MDADLKKNDRIQLGGIYKKEGRLRKVNIGSVECK